MKFIDEARIEVHAGKGGDGAVSFRREKYVPRGGPDGGDGGRGGSIYAVADRNINTLIDYRYARIHRAKDGEKGRGAQCNGRGAEDIVLRMPVGTVVTDLETGEVVADLAAHGQIARARPGRPRRPRQPPFQVEHQPRAASVHARRARRKPRARTSSSSCSPTSACSGMPNAGKSTFIRAVSSARPKVADYPFTTLHPNLGVVRVDMNRSFVVADIPGLIEGAAEGAGLGHQFLRHLARTRLLLHLVDLAPFDAGADPVRDARAIVGELRKYDERLYRKPRWLVLNKVDLLAPAERARAVGEFVRRLRWKGPRFVVSALTGEGCRELCYAIMNELERKP